MTIARPRITIEIAFSSLPLATPVWVDVTAYLDSQRGLTIRRGRQNELGKIETGNATITLRNVDRRFDPLYASSPYYPNILPGRRVRISATWNSVVYRLFTGFITTWPPDYPGGQDAYVTINAADGFKLFGLNKISLSRDAEYSHVRVAALLDALGWLSTDRALSTGRSLIQAVALDRTPALQHLQTVADSENGLIFIDGAGRVVFQHRHYRFQAVTSVQSQATFGDAGGNELPYLDLKPSYDDSQLYNEVTVTRVGGAPQTKSDATSQLQFFTRSLDKSGLLLTTDVETASAAKWLLDLYSTPAVRFPQIVTTGDLAPATLWPQLLGRTLSDKITVRKRPPGSGLIQQDCYIEAVNHQFTRGQWTTSWQLSPARTINAWILGVAGHSELGVTTIPAY